MRTTIGLTMLALATASPALASDGAVQPSLPVNPNVISCMKVPAEEMERFVGAPAQIRETSANLCSWAGGNPDAYVKVMYFLGEKQGVPPGKERAYFDQIIEGEKAQLKPGELVEIQDVGESAWGVKIAENETDYYAVYLFKGKDNVTIATNGIGYDATVEIARLAASRM